MEMLPSEEALNHWTLFSVGNTAGECDFRKIDSERLLTIRESVMFKLGSGEQARTRRIVFGDPDVVKVEIKLRGFRQGESARNSGWWDQVKLTVATEYTDGGQAGDHEPILREFKLHLPESFHSLMLKQECLLKDGGKGEVTRWPVNGDEARPSVGDRHLASLSVSGQIESVDSALEKEETRKRFHERAGGHPVPHTLRGQAAARASRS